MYTILDKVLEWPLFSLFVKLKKDATNENDLNNWGKDIVSWFQRY